MLRNHHRHHRTAMLVVFEVVVTKPKEELAEKNEKQWLVSLKVVEAVAAAKELVNVMQKGGLSPT